jgi:hypothetical protein
MDDARAREVPPADLLATMFAAISQESRWAEVVARATAWVGGAAGGLQIRRLAPELSMSIATSGIDAAFGESYGREYFRLDPHLEHVEKLPARGTLLSRDLLEDGAYRRSAFHAEWVRPQGLHDLQGAVLLRTDELLVTFATYAAAGRRFDRGTKARLDALVPSLAQAVKISLDLQDLAAARRTIAAAEEARRLVAVRVDRQLRLARAVDDTFTIASLPFTIHRAEVRAVDPACQADLERAVSAAVGGITACVWLRDPTGRRREVTIVPALAEGALTRACVDLLIWIDADDEPAPSFRELPPSLQRIAARLARGVSDKEIAVDLGMPLPTVRTYVARVLRRLGARSRRELMRRQPAFTSSATFQASVRMEGPAGG